MKRLLLCALFVVWSRVPARGVSPGHGWDELFISHFNPQEIAAIDFLTTNKDVKAEFVSDQGKAEGDSAHQMAPLTEKWRGRADDLAKQATTRSGKFAQALARHALEDFYLRERLDQLGGNYTAVGTNLAEQAKAARAGDQGGLNRLLGALRVASFDDLKDLAENQHEAKGEALASWAKAHLTSGAKYDDAGLAGPKPGSKAPAKTPSAADDLQARFEKALAALPGVSDIDRAIIHQIATDKDKQEIADGASKKNWHAEALKAAQHNTAPDSELRKALATSGNVDDKAFASYTCAGVNLGGATTSATPAMNQLLDANAHSVGAASSADPEAAKAGADIASTSALQKFCQDAANAAKVSQQHQPLGLEHGLTINPPPSPTGVIPGPRTDAAGGKFTASSSASGSGGPDSTQDKLARATIGGSAGWIGGLILATLMGLGPLGFIMLAVGGGALGAMMALKNSKKSGGSGSS